MDHTLRLSLCPEMPFHGGSHLRTVAVQQYSLVNLAHVENIAHVVGGQPFNVPQRHDGALGRRQVGDRLLDHMDRFTPKQIKGRAERPRQRLPR